MDLQVVEQKYMAKFRQLGYKSVTNLTELTIKRLTVLLKDIENSHSYRHLYISLFFKLLNLFTCFNKNNRYKAELQRELVRLKSLISKGRIPQPLRLQYYALKIIYLNKMRNFQHIKKLKSKIQVIERVDCGFIYNELVAINQQGSSLSQIDEDIFTVTEFSIKEHSFHNGLPYLKLCFQVRSRVKDLEIKNLQVLVRTDAEGEGLRELESQVNERVRVTEGKRGSGRVETSLIFQKSYRGGFSFLIPSLIRFKAHQINYELKDFKDCPHFKMENVRLADVPIVCFLNHGFVHRLNKEAIFFEEKNRNLFFISLSLFNGE